MNDFEAYVTCPYNKSHRILKSRFQIHLTKCSKQYEKCIKDTKINCEFNSSHLLEPEEYEHHLSMCPSRANVICEQYVLGQDEQDIGIISLEDACNVQPNISNEDWSGNNPTYNPVKQTEDKNIIRLPIAMSKSEKKEFRQFERDRILFLENNNNISNNNSKISIIKQKTDFDEPLKAPKQLPKAILCNQDLTNYLISKLNKVSIDIDNSYNSSRKENLISKNISDEEEKENISKEGNNVAAFQTSFQNISKVNKIFVEIGNNSSKKGNLILKSIFDEEEKKNVFEEKNNVVTLSQNISKLNRISMDIDSSLSKKENLILKNISDEEEKENVSEEESNIAVSSQNISKIKKNILEVKTDFKTKVCISRKNNSEMQTNYGKNNNLQLNLHKQSKIESQNSIHLKSRIAANIFTEGMKISTGRGFTIAYNSFLNKIKLEDNGNSHVYGYDED
ncbi:putative neugrin-like protein DDB_G0288135 isoform X1 [Apis cerana]|uniref:Gametocyte-specific factor n=1 Tax=Apis cerana cerana TaxID=94128 RepID=A0A2A3E0M9_APICC|nr:putative neugrin-like protein DDB_G0288135 isoform X1 [Apis cerana]XP_028524225.1 putative neugrin-like protein DDB_G0288135 isoform X1 [Apis cerana]PBC25305.1 Gametocyte-specific factor [Apis cerana cerana]